MSNNQQQQFIINDLAHMQQFANIIANYISPNFIILLNGEIGAGKTTLVRSIIQNLGVTGTIKSPTFTLVEQYDVNDGMANSRLKDNNHYSIYHFDLYRFCQANEWLTSGFDDYIATNPNNKFLAFIEWGSKANNLIDNVNWVININHSMIDEINNQRTIEITAYNEVGIKLLSWLTAKF